MSPKSFAVSCGIAVLATLLGMPAQVRAQGLTESVSKMSSAEIHRILKDAPPAPPQSTAQPRSKSIRTNVIAGAVLGALAGVATGALLNLSCANEQSSGCWDRPIVFGTLGAGIGAGLGAVIGSK